MFDALMRDRAGAYRLVIADEVRRRFGSAASLHVFICPICRERLTPAAMSSHSMQTAHFKHKRNSKRAQECERFSSTYGSSLPVLYQRMPLPMFIRRKMGDAGRFVVEGGFRTPSDNDMALLSDEGARLCVATRAYGVNRERFSGGLMRIPFRELTLSPQELVWLEGSVLDYGSVWGYPEQAKRVMVFLRDEFTGQGRRVRRNESVESGTSAYLLCQQYDVEGIRRLFVKSACVGRVDCGIGAKTLSVIQAKIPKRQWMTSGIEALLDGEGITVSDATAVSRIVWPPSLCADGEVRPLFTDDDVLLCVDKGQSDANRLFAREGSGMVDEVRSLPIRSTGSERFGHVNVGRCEHSLVVSSIESSYERATMIGSASAAAYEELVDFDAGYSCDEEDEGIIVETRRPTTIQVLRRDGAEVEVKDEGLHTFAGKGPDFLLLIKRPCFARYGEAILWQWARAVAVEELEEGQTPPDATLSHRTRGKGVAVAMMRRMGVRCIASAGRSHEIALARRGQ